MNISFRKYHGTGNDFILIDNMDGAISLTPGAIRKMCDRHFGIGADGLILLNASKNYRFQMGFYNSDGSSDAMCGNGGRCAVAFARHIGLIDTTCDFEAYDGIHQAEIAMDHAKKPIIKMSMRDADFPEKLSDNEYFINTGAPHLVIFENHVDELDIFALGTSFSNDKRLRGRANVNFVEIFDNNKLHIRTFERGVENETLSCGTGTTAAALTFAEKYFPEKPHSIITVDAHGGTLKVHYSKNRQRFNNVFLEGAAEVVFVGKWN